MVRTKQSRLILHINNHTGLADARPPRGDVNIIYAQTSFRSKRLCKLCHTTSVFAYVIISFSHG